MATKPREGLDIILHTNKKKKNVLIKIKFNGNLRGRPLVRDERIALQCQIQSFFEANLQG